MSAIYSYFSEILKDLTIPEDDDTSTVLDVGEWNKGAIQVPATMTNSSLDVEGSIDGATWSDIPDGGGTLSITTSDAGVFPLPVELFSYRYIRLVGSGNEVAERVLKVFLKG